MKVISNATIADAQACNVLVPPMRGAQAGGGIHIPIPDDWQARILAGQEVPGCTYAHLEIDGTLSVSDSAQAALLLPAITSGIPAAEFVNLNTKLATAVVVGAISVGVGAAKGMQ